MLEEGRNCGRLLTADRCAVLIDGKAYFDALDEALELAQQQVLVVGWDFDSRLRLHPDRPLSEQPTLGERFAALTERRPGLAIHVLTWDYAMLYAFEREPRQEQRMGRLPGNVQFARDDSAPLGASLHQKLVVIDDDLLFCGGFDLCDVRWDTPEHDPESEVRRALDGKRYPPHHDVQMLVSGPIARQEGERIRARWTRVTGAAIEAPEPRRGMWPPGVPTWASDLEVACARTVADGDAGEPTPTQHLRALWVDTIEHAEDWLYIETPFFTSRAITEAMVASLRRPQGPEIVIVTAERVSGWVEKNTMSVLRDRRLAELYAADEHDRLRVYVPFVPTADGERVHVKVHSKVCVADGRIGRVGSSNSTDRSLGVDRETDLVFGTDDAGAAVAHRLTGTLLGEHLDADPARVMDDVATDGLIATIEAHAGGERTLVLHERDTGELVDRIVPRSQLVDPSEPPQPADLLQLLVQPAPHEANRFRWIGIAWWVVALAALVVVNLLDLVRYGDVVLAMGRYGEPSLVSMLGIAGVFIVGGVLMVPLTLLIVQTGLLFGPGLGFAYACIGAFVGAAAYWWIGRRASGALLDPFAGPRTRAVMQAVAERGVLAVVAVRLVPVAPHIVVGLLAGASRVSFRDYMLGSVLGMAPGIVVLVWLGDAFTRIDGAADVWKLWPALAAAALSLGVAWMLTRRASRAAKKNDLDPPSSG